MIQRAVPLVLLLAFLSSPAHGQNVGKLAGTVRFEQWREPLAGASVIVQRTGLGATTDAEGNFVIVGVPAGSYTVRVTYIGFEPAVLQGVVVNAGYTRELQITLQEQVTKLDEAVVAYERPLIQRDAIGVSRIVSAEEMGHLPVRGVKEVAAMQGGVVEGNERESLHIRGGREQETVYFVDGVKVIGYTAVPQPAILEQEMLIGSLPAKYGDAMSGVVSIATKSGNQDFFGSVEAISSKLLDGYGYNLASASAGGPVVGDKLSFFVAGELLHLDDRNPSAIPIPALRPERLQFIRNNPQSLRFVDAAGNAVYLPFPAHLSPTVDSDGDGEQDAVTFADVLSAIQVPYGLTLNSPGPVQAAEVEPLESYGFRKTQPNSGLDVIRSSGNLNFRPNHAVHFRAGYRYEDYRTKEIAWRQILFSPDRFRRTDRKTIGISAAATHRLSASSFYQVQVDWSQYREKQYDPKFSDDVADVLFYGDIDSPVNFVSTLYRNWDGNDSLYVPRFEDGQMPSPTGVYNVFHGPGVAGSSYSKDKNRQFRITANATTQIGLHQLEFGGEFERRTERHFEINGATPLARYYQDGSAEAGVGVPAYDELPFSLMGGLVSYWGYDYLGLNEANEQDVDQFVEGVRSSCNDTENGPAAACNVAPYEPIYYAGYVQDKFEYTDLVLSLGLRVDVFDNNTFVLKDRYALVPIARASDLQQRPVNIGPDFAVYFDSGGNVVGFRDQQGNFFDDLGQRARGTDINILGSPKVPASMQAQLSSSVFDDYKPRVSFLPRIGLSFSVTDEALFFAHLDKTSQRPFELPFEGLHGHWQTSRQYGFLANNGLLPETTIEYELGFRHRLNRRAALTISGFYKKVNRLIRLERLQLAFPNGYVTWANDDFGTIKGLEMEFDLRRTKHVAFTANYTLQYARGTGSDAQTARNRSWEPTPLFLAPLDFDQRHTITANLDYRIGAGDGPNVFGFKPFERFGVNVLVNLHSGRPFSRLSDTPPQRAVGPPNGDTMPWSSLVNIRLDRRFDLGGTLSLTPFLWVENLFDVDNVRNVYPVTGQPDENGFLSSGEGGDFLARQEIPATAYVLYGLWMQHPSFYGTPRLVRMGMQMTF